MGNGESFEVRGPRYIGEGTTNSMLDTAVKPHKLPACAHRAMTHAAGCSIAGLAARVMRANMNFLQNQVDICWGELMHEKDFSVEKLEEHIDILGALNLLLFTFTADRVSAIVDTTKEEAKETENILTKAFARLPQEDLAAYNDGIVQLRGRLEDEVLFEMMELRDKIKEYERLAQEMDWRDTIQMLLLVKVGPRLSEIYERLGSLSASVNSIVGKVRKDWKDDVEQIESDEHV